MPIIGFGFGAAELFILLIILIMGVVIVRFLMGNKKSKKDAAAGSPALGTCPGCSATNPPAARFCRKCGQELG